MVPDWRAHGPHEADILFFEEHGWFLSPVVLSAEALDGALAAVARFHAGERDWRFPEDGGAGAQPTHPAAPRVDDFVALKSAALRGFVLQPVIGAIAARLLRTSEVRLLEDQLVSAPPLGRGEPEPMRWHSDGPYWPHCSSEKILTAWIPLTGGTGDAGPMLFIDRSHGWARPGDPLLFDESAPDTPLARMRVAGAPVAPVAAALQRGQISFHAKWVTHGRAPNRSPQAQISLTIALQAGENAYRRAEGSGAEMIQDRWCRRLADGRPDYADPWVCPVVWREEEA